MRFKQEVEGTLSRDAKVCALYAFTCGLHKPNQELHCFCFAVLTVLKLILVHLECLRTL